MGYEKYSSEIDLTRRKHPPNGRLLQLEGVDMTRETLVKIEGGIQHIRASQLRGIRDALKTTYDELLAEQ